MPGPEGTAAAAAAGAAAALCCALRWWRERAREALWLEDVDGAAALRWVRDRNRHALDALGDPAARPLYRRLLSIMDAKDKIPHPVVRRGQHLYNFWQDDANKKGLWRRTSMAEYRKKDISWEVLLDLDALAKAEDVSWVWAGSVWFDEGPQTKWDHVLVKLSPGGSDAVVTREFDPIAKKFVDGGFHVPEAKTDVCWKSRDVLLVGTDFGPGSMTQAGYPRVVKEWRRGTPLTAAVQVFEGQVDDVCVNSTLYYDRGEVHHWRSRYLTFYSEEHSILHGGEWRPLDLPRDISVSCFKDCLLLSLRSDWAAAGREFRKGSLLSVLISGALSGDLSSLTPLFEPTETCSLEEQAGTLRFVVLHVLEDVKCELRYWEYEGGGRWALRGTDKGYGMETVSVTAVDSDSCDAVWVTLSGYTRPTTFLYADRLDPSRPLADLCEELKATPPRFDAAGLRVTQQWATSRDGTKVPYFQVARADLKHDGSAPTLLYGYGGFECSELPGYSGCTGAAWLERGGVYADANIRGGNEYGPRWHQAALRERRPRAFEDFEAVAEDLVARGVTSPGRLGAMGGSNGGLLIGAMLTRPGSARRFGALVSACPILDMRRYHTLHAGHSWMEEYGDPDKPAHWAFLREYSPYHNVHDGREYPPILFTTSTKDDRVHPGHARRTVLKMLGTKSCAGSTYYYENIEGGHAGAADNKQRAFVYTLEYAFLWQALGGADDA